MGYSCNAIATFALDAIIEILNRDNGAHPRGISNGYRGNKDGTTYFYERGKDRDDGAITQPVRRELPNGRVRDTGGMRISKDGVIERMPGTNEAQRTEATRKAYRKMVKVYGRAFSDPHCADPAHPCYKDAKSSFLVVA